MSPALEEAKSPLLCWMQWVTLLSLGLDSCLQIMYCLRQLNLKGVFKCKLPQPVLFLSILFTQLCTKICKQTRLFVRVKISVLYCAPTTCFILSITTVFMHTVGIGKSGSTKDAATCKRSITLDRDAQYEKTVSIYVSYCDMYVCHFQLS